jgi:hypothetical protein
VLVILSCGDNVDFSVKCSQVNAGGYMTEPRLSMNPLSGGYPSSQISQAGRSPSPHGLYSNNQASHFPGGNAGYTQTYNVVPTGNIETYGNAVLGSQYRPSIAQGDTGFHGRPYVEYRNFQSDQHTPAAATCSYSLMIFLILSIFNNSILICCYYISASFPPTLRPQHGGLPDYSGRFGSQHPKYYP